MKWMKLNVSKGLKNQQFYWIRVPRGLRRFGNFEFYQPVFKKLTLADLNSLQKKGVRYKWKIGLFIISYVHFNMIHTVVRMYEKVIYHQIHMKNKHILEQVDYCESYRILMQKLLSIWIKTFLNKSWHIRTICITTA